MHNPTCKLHASQSFEDHSPVRERRTSDVSDIFLSPEAYKATQAVEFIAEHLRNEDEYVQVTRIRIKQFKFFKMMNIAKKFSVSRIVFVPVDHVLHDNHKPCVV